MKRYEHTIAELPEMNADGITLCLTKFVCSAHVMLDFTALTNVLGCLGHWLLAALPALGTPSEGGPKLVHHTPPCKLSKGMYVWHVTYS